MSWAASAPTSGSAALTHSSVTVGTNLSNASPPLRIPSVVRSCVVSSAGAGYHHVGSRHDTGWIAKLDGRYEVRRSRVIPLLTMISVILVVCLLARRASWNVDVPVFIWWLLAAWSAVLVGIQASRWGKAGVCLK